MTDFKVGDRVRADDGDEGIVTRIEGEVIWADFETAGNAYDNAFALTLVDRPLKNFDGDEGDMPLQDWEKELLLTPFEQSVHRVTGKIADLLIAKNKAYGDSALNPVRIFSKASRIEQLNVRIDDKISRIQRGTDYGDEDTVRDLIGYLVLRLIAEESE
jgi:hypothetical protein